MTRFIRAAAAALAFLFLGFAASASYADGLPYRSKVSAPDPISEDSFRWTGFYVGGGAGHTWWHGDCDRCETGASGDFWQGDVKAGFDVKLGSSPWLVGLFGTWTPTALSSDKRIDNIYSLGGRIGYITPNNVLFYTGGKAVWLETMGEQVNGWGAIAGFEQPLFNRVTWGLEYGYTKLDDNIHNVGINAEAQSVTARLNFKF